MSQVIPQKQLDMLALAGVAEMSPDALVRAKAQALTSTMQHIGLVKSALYSLEADLDAQHRELVVELNTQRHRESIEQHHRDQKLAALQVLILTPHIREYLELHDPQALAQAERAVKEREQ